MLRALVVSSLELSRLSAFRALFSFFDLQDPPVRFREFSTNATANANAKRKGLFLEAKQSKAKQVLLFSDDQHPISERDRQRERKRERETTR